MECRMIRVDYESKVTWRKVTDIVRCSPEFHGAPRHDCVIVHVGPDDASMFCRLVFVFTYSLGEQTYALALVQPFDLAKPGTETREVDRHLALCRLRERPRADSIIISARSIRRGAVLLSDTSRAGEYLVLDMLDGDMFMRAVELFPDRNLIAQRRKCSTEALL